MRSSTACNDRAIAEFLDMIPQPYTEVRRARVHRNCRVRLGDGTTSNFAVVVDGAAVGSIGVTVDRAGARSRGGRLLGGGGSAVARASARAR